MPINTNYYEFTENAIKNKSNSVGNKITEFKIKKGQTVKFGLFLYSKPTQSTTFTFYKNEGDDFESFANFQTYTLNVKFERTYTATEDTEIYIRMWGNADSEIFEFQLWAELDELTNYLKYEEQNYILDIQQEMLKGDYFVKESDGWKEVHNWITIYNKDINKNIDNIENEQHKTITTSINLPKKAVNEKPFSNILTYENNWEDAEHMNLSANLNVIYCIYNKSNFSELTYETIKETLEKADGFIKYKTEEPTKLACTEEQSAVLDKLNNLGLFDGTNNIITTEDIALLSLKYVADTKTYVDNQIADMQNQLNTINELLSTTATSSILLDNLQTDLESEVM